MAAALTVHVSVGTPWATGEECPICHFDSMITVLLIVNSSPGFVTKCGRPVCRKG